MRLLTRKIAFEPGWWNAQRQREVAELFDALAPDWPVGDEPGLGLEIPLKEAFSRGLSAAPAAERQWVVDLGGGNGRAIQLMAERFPEALVVDISAEMLRHVPAGSASCVQADASQLPFAEGSIDVLVLANMFLFPFETDRVLAAGGVLVWINSLGGYAPIHLTADEVDRALPGAWSGVSASVGEGTWSVHWRCR